LANTPIYSLAATASDHLFAGTVSTGVFRSTDGVTWTSVNSTFTNPVTSLAVNSFGAVFAGVLGDGVFSSSDDGQTWTQRNTGLTDLRVESLAISLSGFIFAGTPSGVFRSVASTTLGPPATLTLTPLTAVNPVGTQHCVTATVKDASGNPVPSVAVRFSVGPSVPTTFPSPSSGTGTTNANGQATFCYTASLPGADRIHAFADANNNGTQDPTEPFGDAAKTWTPPASTQLCEVTITDGGWIIANNTDRATFGGNAKVLADGTVQGQQRYQDQGPVQAMNVHSTAITATTCSQDRTTASIFGKATIDGAGSYVFRIDVTDTGAGGSNDTYGIMLETGYQSGQHQLGAGNVTIH